jgi:hypothetical protein
MSGELEALLKLVSEGKITAEEAAPIVAALEAQSENGGSTDSAGRPRPTESRPRDETRRGGTARRPWPAGESGSSSPRTAAP